MSEENHNTCYLEGNKEGVQMKYKIKNQSLEVEITTRGAELQSIKDKKGTEYLWQGDEAFWKGQALNLFPYIGRFTDGSYIYEGKRYQMRKHGFLCEQELSAEQLSEEQLRFTLKANADTRQCYPFDFCYHIEYKLVDKMLQITTIVQNEGDKKMYFGIGGHPGFNIPLEGKGEFEDYYLEFPVETRPIRVGHTDTGYRNGEDREFSLRDGKYIDLRHDLFDHDAIVLREMPKEVIIKGTKSERTITVCYPQMTYLGIWHAVKKEAPYVCIEPWTSLPSHIGVVEDLAKQEDLLVLSSGEVYENSWSIEIQ